MSSSKRIRVAFVINDFLIGGAQRLYLELFRHLESDRYEFHLITLMQFEGRPDMYEAVPPHVSVHRLSFTGFWDFSRYLELYRLYTKITPDLMFTSLFFSNTITRLVALFGSYRVIAIEQNTYTWKNFFHRTIDRLLAHRTDVMVAASSTVAEFASTQAGIRRDKFVVIHNSIDIDGIRREQEDREQKRLCQKELGLTDADTVIINVARLTTQKNHAMLFEAFAQFSVTFPSYTLVVFGDGSLKEMLEMQIAHLHMEKKILLAGTRANLFPYYGISAFFASPSFIEGFGIAHAEALASGIPLVSTKTAGPDEMIEEGKNGYFVEPTVESITAGLIQMAQRGVSLSPEEIRRTVAQFDSRETAHKYNELFTRVVQEKI